MMAVLTAKDNPPAGCEHAGCVILAANCAVGLFRLADCEPAGGVILAGIQLSLSVHTNHSLKGRA
jgi:hypothetical protein